MRSTSAASFVAIIICTANFSSDLASAQNVAGKLAARTKLTESSSTKKKRSFWRSRKSDVVEDEEDKDGECNWRWWDVLLAQSDVIIKSVEIVIYAIISWLWYLRAEYYVTDEEEVKEEKKGGKCEPLALFDVTEQKLISSSSIII